LAHSDNRSTAGIHQTNQIVFSYLLLQIGRQ